MLFTDVLVSAMILGWNVCWSLFNLKNIFPIFGIHRIQIFLVPECAVTQQNLVTLSDGYCREIQHNTVPWNSFFRERSGAVGMRVVSVLLGAVAVVGVGSKATFAKLVHLYFSNICYFRMYLYQQWSLAGMSVEVCSISKIYFQSSVSTGSRYSLYLSVPSHNKT